MKAKRLSYPAAAAAVLALSACVTVSGTREVTEADRVAVLKGMNRHWVFDKVSEYLKDSVILIYAPVHGDPERMLPYRQARNIDVTSASENDGLVTARWELKEDAGLDNLFLGRGRWDVKLNVEPEPTVLDYTVTFGEVEGGMKIELSITTDGGAEADRLYYTRFWKFMSGRWK
jgi:hypothetical protein